MKLIPTLVSLLVGAGIASAAPTANIPAEQGVAPEGALSFKINAYSPPPSTSKAKKDVTPDSANLFIVQSYRSPSPDAEE
ncbi:hypothetical protein BBP40_004331 [Aspergillus hancockii]|nr:hypothetical protein BBP40_004331 [Aspergillus hancockii]